MVTGEEVDAFRSGGADEVVVVMRGTSIEDGAHPNAHGGPPAPQGALHAYGKEVAPFLTASCGVVSTTDPATDALGLIARANAEQKRAKLASKKEPGESLLAVEGQAVEKVKLGDE